MDTTIVYIIKQIATLIIVVLGIGVFGCKSSQASTTNNATEPLLVYRKSQCYGACPAYEATVYRDGAVQLVPQKNLPITDTLRFTLTDKELKTLTSAIVNLNYPTLQKLYKTQWTDMPATHLHFYENTIEVKHIKHQEGGPESLIQFIKDVHDLLWKYIEGN